MSRLLMDAVLSHGPRIETQRLVLLTLARFAAADGSAAVSNKVLKHFTQLDEVSLVGAVHQLLINGWIKRENPAAALQTYRLSFHRLGLRKTPRSYAGPRVLREAVQ